MIYVPRNASDDEVLELILGWIDVLAEEDYDAVANSLGYLRAFDTPPAQCIRQQIKNYRSPDYYPGVEDFVVSNWRTAAGGNPTPKKKLTWFEPNETRLVGALELDLPLNGKWSDLEADFVWFENDDRAQGFFLRLEDISSFSQIQREIS